MMREQQQFMAQTAELQRQMAAVMMQQQQQPTVSQQSPSDSSVPYMREYRAEGITMSKFFDDDVDDYIFSAKLYFESKNIKYGSDAPQQRPLSLLVAYLKGQAADWYREYVSHDGNYLQSVTQFEELLAREFTAPDRQEHLRDQLLRLCQKSFNCLEDYVSTLRSIICKVEDMSDIDKVRHFQNRGYSRPPQRGNSFRANQGPFRRIVEDDSDYEADDEDYADGDDEHVEVIEACN